MKTCNKCQNSKPTSEFNKKGTGFQPYCRDCDKAASRARYHGNKSGHIEAVRLNNQRYVKRNREYVTEYFKTHPCVDCGNSDIRVLEFDHVRGEKTGNLGEMVSIGFSLERIKKEIDLCDVRCANCHRIITQQRGGYWRSLIIAQ